MTSLDNYRTHFCPDSNFSLISENDGEFEACNCYGHAQKSAVTSVAQSEAIVGQTSSVAAETAWYLTLTALARVCGPSTMVEPTAPAPAMHENAVVEQQKELVQVRRC